MVNTIGLRTSKYRALLWIMCGRNALIIKYLRLWKWSAINEISKTVNRFLRISLQFLNTLTNRSVQNPALAILSGQKSAPERIQATDFICSSLCRHWSRQSATKKTETPRNTAGAQPVSFLKSEWRALPLGTGGVTRIPALWPGQDNVF